VPTLPSNPPPGDDRNSSWLDGFEGVFDLLECGVDLFDFLGGLF
jgi:hypothetical protein